MIDKLKTTAAVLALVAAPSFASADSMAVSLSATFAQQEPISFDGEDLSGGDAACSDAGENSTCRRGGDGAEIIIVGSGSLDTPTAISVSAATGANAAASTSAVTVEGTADATFANSGGGNVAASVQEGSFDDDAYTSRITFGDATPSNDDQSPTGQ